MIQADRKSVSATRRKFLGGAAVGVAAIGAPSVVSAQGPISMRWQSTWPSKDIFHEYALDYAKKVNDMTGGELKIEVLPAGAVVPAFGLLEAVSKGTLDGGHGVLVYHYGKQTALALWGSGPAFGMDANMLLSWHKYGGGKQLLEKLYASIGAHVRIGWIFLLALFLNCAVFAALGLVAAMVMNSHEEMSNFNTYALTPMSFLCATFFSTSQLPLFFRYMIEILPLTHASYALRQGGPAGMAPGVSIVILMAYLGVFLGVGILQIRKVRV